MVAFNVYASHLKRVFPLILGFYIIFGLLIEVFSFSKENRDKGSDKNWSQL
jgi:hypothetical protein